MSQQKGKHREVLGWSYISIDRIPRSAYGVYAFWYRKTGKCIYVGQAAKQPVKKRLKDHWRGSHNETLKLWLRAFGGHLKICYMKVELNKIDCFERRLIRLWKPEANKQYNR